MLVGKSCPWCHRTLLVYKLKNLSKQVKVIFLEADINSGQWIFKEKFKGCKTLINFIKKDHKIMFSDQHYHYYLILKIIKSIFYLMKVRK